MQTILRLTVVMAVVGLALVDDGRAAVPTSRPAVGGEDSAHVFVIPQFTGTIRFGTDLTQPPWDTAARTTGFLKLSTRQAAAHPTYVYACYDRTSLWLGYRCEGIDGRSAKSDARERDGRVWWDDGVEFYCSPDHSRRHFTQFAANASGIAYDGQDTDGKWNAKWQVKSAVDEKGFTVVMRIPFAQLKASVPAPGQHWNVNFARHGPLSGSSTWAWCYNAMHDPRQFGKLIFGGPGLRPVRWVRSSPWAMGINRVGVENISSLTCRVTGWDRCFEPILATEARAGEGGFEFLLENDAVRTIRMEFLGSDGNLLARACADVHTPELTPRLEDWTRRFTIMQRVSGRWPADVAADARKLVIENLPKLDEAIGLARNKAGHSSAVWTRLAEILDGFDKTLGDLSCHARTLEHFPQAAFAVGLESPMRKVMIRDFPFEGRFAPGVHIDLAANEHEGLQVVVIPFRRDLENVTVKASVQSAAGGTGAGLSCAVSLVGHVDVNDDPPYESTYKEFWPDPLLSFLQSAPVKAGEHVAFWVDVAAAKGTPAGEYQGRIEVTATGCTPIVLPLTVRVWKFELPDGTHLRNAFTYHENPIRGFYKERWNEQLAHAYQDMILDHRLGIDHLYRKEPPDLDTLRRAVAKGMNAFNVVFAGSGGMKEHVAKALDEFVPRIRKAGLLELAYVYGFDEIKAEKFGEAKAVFDEVHRRCPGMPTMTTAQDTSFGKETGLREAVDIWVPLTPGYDLQEAEELRREGKQMWWYICLVPIRPYANWFVEYPAIESRLLMGAMSRKYQVDGFLYYLINNGWERNKRVISSGPYTSWDPASCENSKHKWANGDGNLIYPGPDGPLSTIRLENIRDGLEDYEYLHLLAERFERVQRLPAAPARDRWVNTAGPLLVVPDRLVRSVVEYTLDPVVLANWREQMARAIVAADTLLSGG